MTERAVIPLGGPDVYWGEDSHHTYRFSSSGIAGLPGGGGYYDERANIQASSREVGGLTSMSDEDTSSFAEADNAMFEALTNRSSFGGFRLNILGSAEGPYELPTSDDLKVGWDSEINVYIDVIHRTVSGSGNISSSFYFGTSGGDPDFYYFRGGTFPTNTSWQRTLYRQTTFYHNPVPWNNPWMDLREALLLGQASGHLSMGSLVKWQIAYMALVIDYEPAEPVASDAPRRVFPRDDGLVGGAAPRVWPPSKARQSSNRVGGGSFL